MSVMSNINPFEQFEAEHPSQKNMSPSKVNQFYHTAYVQNAKSSWVDKKTVEETSYDPAVEPSVMFGDEMNQTKSSFVPASTKKGSKFN